MKKLSKRKLFLLTACLCSAALNHGFAKEAGESMDVYGGEEFVITATKTPLEEKKVPMAVEVVTQEKLQSVGAYNVRDALRLATNIDVQEAGMTGNQVMLRGMETKHTLILIDGRRMAAENTGSTMNVYELGRINLADVERVEIIRGNGSALYGSDAMGGVINIITKKATKPGGSVEVHTGTKSKGSSFSYASGKQGKASVKISGGIEDAREQSTSYYSQKYAGKVTSSNMHGPRRFLNMGFDYELGNNKGLALDLNFMREQFASGSTQPGTEGHYNYDNNRSDYALTYYGKDDKHDYNLRVYYNTLKKANQTYENKVFKDFDNTSYDTLVVEGKDSIKLDERNTLTFGAEYTSTSMKGTRFGGGGDNKYTETIQGISKEGSEKDVDTYAAYVQDELKLSDKWLLIPAVRYDHHKAFGGNTSPKISSTYSFSDHSRIKVNYGKGYRAPTVFELYSTMDKRMGFMQVQVLGNADLEPEKSTNFDLSLEGERGKTSAK
ncbi:MAG: TonB-dependent receptor plug domain-containing protein, partial [Phascolarctobacterium sp.]